MRTTERSPIERLIFQARAAARCREAACEAEDPETREALLRAADRYSESVAELATVVAQGGAA